MLTAYSLSVQSLIERCLASMLSPISAQDRKRPQCIAHRGHRAALPENTMEAFVSAIEAGADALEIDVHLTKDGQVVISHVSD